MSVAPALFLSRLIGLYEGAIIVYAIMTWFASGSSGVIYTVYRALASICEPFVGLFRRILPTALVGGSGIDFSPLAAILALSLLQRVIYAFL